MTQGAQGLDASAVTSWLPTQGGTCGVGAFRLEALDLEVWDLEVQKSWILGRFVGKILQGAPATRFAV